MANQPDLPGTPAGPPSPGAGRSPSPLRGRLWPALAGLLAVALLLAALFSYATISSANDALADARASLAFERDAHATADVRIAALGACVAAMKSDVAALTDLDDRLVTIDRRVSGSGDWEVARLAYQTMLEKAVSDFYASWVDVSKNDQEGFKRDYANALLDWDRLEELKESFQASSTSLASDRSDVARFYAELEVKLAGTEATCTGAMDRLTPAGTPAPSLAD